jgi:hypothetical protein
MGREPDIWSRIEIAASGVKDLTKDNLRKIKQRGRVPSVWHYDLVESAKKKGVPLTYEQLKKLH